MKTPFRLSGPTVAILFSLNAINYIAHAQTNPPVPIGPRTVLTDSSPEYFRDRSVQPSSPVGGSLGLSPEALTNFSALVADTPEPGDVALTPDTFGAVGTNLLITMLNSQVRILTRSGTP